jgi:hypothetical protein
MKRLKPSLALILIGLALLLSAAKKLNAESEQNRGKQHQTEPDPHSGNIQQQQPQIPLSALQSAEVALSEALAAIKQQAVAAKEPAEASKVTFCSASVVVNEVLALIGLGYLVFMRLQWSEIRKQRELTGKTLLLQFRPRLIIRNVVIHPQLDATDTKPNLIYYFARNELARGQCYVANVGDSKATVTESLCMVYCCQGPLPMRRPYEGRDGNNPITGIIEAGDRKTMIFDSGEPMKVGHQEIGLMGYSDFRPIWSVYVMGWIEYKDDLGFERRTAFCRKFDPTINRFVTINDPDYERTE